MNGVDSYLAPLCETGPPPPPSPLPSSLPSSLRTVPPPGPIPLGPSSAAPSPTRPLPPAPSTAPRSTHETSITESGSFATARCGCGWYAPARRSRDKSRRDADAHLSDYSAS